MPTNSSQKSEFAQKSNKIYQTEGSCWCKLIDDGLYFIKVLIKSSRAFEHYTGIFNRVSNWAG